MKKIFLGILILAGFLSIFDFFHPGLPLTHDGKDHVARIANFYQNLQEGILIPRWAPNLNWGYGHPILEFLYPLPSYLASLFHGIGFSLVDAAKIVFGIGMIGSGIAMYVWLAEFLSLPAAFIGGILYIFTPYRFVEIYVRGDIGENLAFVFMPLTLFFLYRLFTQEKLRYVFYGAISLAFLILAHNAISLMYLPFILFYCLYLIYQSKNKKFLIRATCFFILLGFGLAAFFWIPGLIEGKYTLRNIVTAGGYLNSFVSFSQLLYGQWSYGISGSFTVQLGIMNWIMLFLGAVLGFGYWRRKDLNYWLIGGLVLYTIVSIFLMLHASNTIWQHVMLLQNFQFPWRFLAIPLFTTSVLGAIVISFVIVHLKFLPNRFRLLKDGRMVTLIVFLIVLFFNKNYWHARAFLNKPESFYSGIYPGTTDTGESSPIWSVRFMESGFSHPVDIISGNAAVTQLIRTGTKHVYVVSSTESAQLRENTLYFPGWEVMIDDQPVQIQYQDPHNRGVMTFFIPSGKHIVTVYYSETRLRLLADFLSLLTMVIIIVWASTSYMTRVSHLRYNKK